MAFFPNYLFRLAIFKGLSLPGMACYSVFMSLFCLLWMPLFYLFWRSVTKKGSAVGGIWALIIGSIVALVQFFLGSFIEPGGFGLSRWVSGFVDIVILPVLIPLFIYLILFCFKFISGTYDFANFALLWLIPGAAMRAVSWSSMVDPILLVLVPVLWASLAVGIPFFINIILNNRIYIIIPASLGILVIPAAASCSYWAFFSQKASLGFLFCVIAVIPMVISMIISYIHAGERPQ